MTAVLFPNRIPEIEEWLAERQAQGFDIRDEMWEGMYVVMTPAPSLRHGRLARQLVQRFLAPAEQRGCDAIEIANVGDPHDHRIPDVTVYDPADADPTGSWLSTATVVVEIRSPGEPHEEKLPFYAAREVSEVVLVDPEQRSVRWLVRAGDHYEPTDRSEMLGLVAAEVAAALEWE